MAKVKVPGYKDDKSRALSDILHVVAEFGSDLIKANAGIIQKGIATGNVNGAEGLLFTMAYVDLLHGGAYRWDYSEDKMPYYNKDVQAQFNWAAPPLPGAILAFLGLGVNVTIPPGYPGGGVNIALPPGASTLQAEVLLNGFVPHVLPKLLSDAAYIQIMERAGQLLNVTTFANFGTGLRAYVESLTPAAEAVGGELQAGRESRLQEAIINASLATETTLG